jgi:hypothetical protein
VVAATRLVRTGEVVSLSLPLHTTAAPDCPNPAEFRMTQYHDAEVGLGSMGFAKDFVGVDYHSDGHTHIDALCHVAYESRRHAAARRERGGGAWLRRNSDTAPSSTEGVAFPIHVLALNAMGLPLLDYMQFEDLRQACESARRWEFLCVTAPLWIRGGTGSPVNPLAIL